MHVHLPQIGRIAEGADAWEVKYRVQNYKTVQKSPPLPYHAHCEHKVLKMFLFMLPGRAPEGLRTQSVCITMPVIKVSFVIPSEYLVW